MRLFTKTVIGEQGEIKTSHDIPNTTIASGATILAIIQLLVTILGNHLDAIPKQQNDKVSNQLKEKNFTVQVLQRVLEIPDSNDRSNSLKILIGANLLNDSENKILEITKTPANVPRWEKRPLEPLTGNNKVDSTQGLASPKIKPIKI